MITLRQLRLIMALSVPAIITNITTPILALTDVAIAGHFGSAIFIAAIAVGSTMFSTLFWLFGFLRMGTSGITAQSFGAKDTIGSHAVLAKSLMVALFIGVLFVIFQSQLCSLMLSLLDVDSQTAIIAQQYFLIVIWSAPALLGMYSLTGWFVGMQDSRTPMWVSLLVNVLNIAASLVFVFVFSLKIEGIAYGTLLAQWIGFLAALFFAMSRYGFRWLPIGRLLDGLSSFFKINTDIFFRTACLVAVTLWFTRAGATQGATMLAVNALLMQLFTLYSYFMDGLAFASEALCGRYLGACDYKELNCSIRTQFVAGFAIAIIFTLLYAVGSEWVMGVLSSEKEVVSIAGKYAVWAMMVPICGFGAFLWDGVFIGLTRTRMMLLSMVIAMAVFFLLYSLLVPTLGNHGLWIAFLSYLLTRGLVLGFAGRKYMIR